MERPDSKANSGFAGLPTDRSKDGKEAYAGRGTICAPPQSPLKLIPGFLGIFAQDPFSWSASVKGKKPALGVWCSSSASAQGSAANWGQVGARVGFRAWIRLEDTNDPQRRAPRRFRTCAENRSSFESIMQKY